jgi:hypothetical protein
MSGCLENPGIELGSNCEMVKGERRKKRCGKRDPGQSSRDVRGRKTVCKDRVVRQDESECNPGSWSITKGQMLLRCSYRDNEKVRMNLKELCGEERILTWLKCHQDVITTSGGWRRGVLVSLSLLQWLFSFVYRALISSDEGDADVNCCFRGICS